MSTSFLFTISFLLHIVTLAAIYFLFRQYTAQRENTNQSTEDFAVLMDNYIEEMKAENDKLLSQLQQQEEKKTPAKMEKPMDQAMDAREEKDTSLLVDTHSLSGDQAELSLEAKVLQLHRQGKKPDEIAKELHCGKTEAELIIKFHA